MSEDESYALAARVDYADAMRYAKSRGWVRADFPRMDIGIFHRGEHEAVLPMDPALRDYASSMLRFAEVLAQAEGLSPERVLQDLVTTKVDRHRPARVGTNDASLGAAVSLLEGIQRALLASACTALQPRPFHPRMSLSQAEEFVAATRFRNTEVGSFVVVIDTPLEVDNTRPGFGREVSTTLMRSLIHIAHALRMDAADRIVNPRPGDPQVSSNLCEAILRMAPASESSDLRFDVAWSPLVAPPPNIPREISIDRTMYEQLEQVASQLRPSRSTARSQYLCVVKELKGSISLEGRPEGETVFLLLLEDETEVRAKAYLGAADYQVAVAAHSSSSLLIIDAELHGIRRGYELRNLTAIKPWQREPLGG